MTTEGWTPSYFGTLCKEIFPKREDEPLVIIEVGTWMGKSAIEMAKVCDKNCKIYCVDTWIGSVEHYDSVERDEEGFPIIYKKFKENIKREGVDDVIIPVISTSTDAIQYFKRNGIKADVIYIDAAHDYENVMKDLENYWQIFDKTKPDNCFFGDDYGDAWGGLINAVNTFSNKNFKKLSLHGVTWFTHAIHAKT
jgi:hypothetical protein